MVSARRLSAAVAILLAVGACGSSPDAGPGARPPTAMTAAGSLRLGHYSSADGLVGFVLDRTGPTPRVRMDGEERVYVLEVISTSRLHTDFVSHERHIGISFMKDGSGASFSGRGRDELSIRRDGDAAPLP
jgi:hypothetical protein